MSFGASEFAPEMEYWKSGMMVRRRRIKRILTILILSSIPPVAGPLIQHCIIPKPIILSEAQDLQALRAGGHYSIVLSEA